MKKIELAILLAENILAFVLWYYLTSRCCGSKWCAVDLRQMWSEIIDRAKRKKRCYNSQFCSCRIKRVHGVVKELKRAEVGFLWLRNSATTSLSAKPERSSRKRCLLSGAKLGETG